MVGGCGSVRSRRRGEVSKLENFDIRIVTSLTKRQRFADFMTIRIYHIKAFVFVSRDCVTISSTHQLTKHESCWPFSSAFLSLSTCRCQKESRH